MKVLLQHGANFRNTKDRLGRNILCSAAADGGAGIVKQLLQAGVDVNPRSNNEYHITLTPTALHVAVEKNEVKVLKVLLQNGANVNAIDEAGLTPLHWASMLRYSDIAWVLLQNGADINALDASSRSALDLYLVRATRTQ